MLCSQQIVYHIEIVSEQKSFFIIKVCQATDAACLQNADEQLALHFARNTLGSFQ